MEIKILLTWYGLFFLFGIIGLPITSIIFSKWQDKGYAFAKYVGLFVVGMVWWLLSSLRIVPFQPLYGYILFGLALCASLFWLYKKKFKISRYMIYEEIIFLAVFLIWSFIRSFNPKAEGTEKMMNLAFMNSLNRTDYMPPKDMWFAQGGNINYYYIGHYFFVVLSKIGNIGISYVYNLALVTIIAQTFVSLYALFMQLFVKSKEWIKITFALLGASWISFGGNMHMAYKWFESYLKGEEFEYWFPDATRIIEYTINEYPAYSIVLGDVHGHYIALPFLVIVLALLLVSLSIKISSKKKIYFNLAISTFIVALYGINSWDFITSVFLFTLVHLYQVFKLEGEIEEKIKRFLIAEITLIFPGVVLLLPYIMNYSPAVGPTGGFPVGIVPFKTKSAPLPWILIWGQFIIAPLLYIIAMALKSVGKKALKTYPVILTIAAICLILGVEVFFIKDIFHESNPPYFRTNSVFKFYYHAWIIFGVAAVWFIHSILNSSREETEKDQKAKSELAIRLKMFNDYKILKWITFFIASTVFVLNVSYIFEAVKDFYPLSNKDIKPTLDGIDYIEKDKNPDYKAIEWIQNNISDQPVILEHVGDAYTYASRISSSTGLITVIGWPTHEWQWRGSADEPFARKGEVEAFYNSTNTVEKDWEFIEKYNVEYIFVGGEEINNYTINNERLNSYGDIVYEEGIAKIIKLNKEKKPQ